jgi:hypothetical protein
MIMCPFEVVRPLLASGFGRSVTRNPAVFAQGALATLALAVTSGSVEADLLQSPSGTTSARSAYRCRLRPNSSEEAAVEARQADGDAKQPEV